MTSARDLFDLEVSIPAIIFKQDNTFVCAAPVDDISTDGNTLTISGVSYKYVNVEGSFNWVTDTHQFSITFGDTFQEALANGSFHAWHENYGFELPPGVVEDPTDSSSDSDLQSPSLERSPSLDQQRTAYRERHIDALGIIVSPSHSKVVSVS